MWPFKKKKGPTPKENLYKALTAASLKGKFGGWIPRYESLVGDLQQGNLKLVRKRCRESSVNSPVIASMISEIQSMVIGRGIQVDFSHTTPRHETKVKALWEEWVNSKMFSSDEEMDFYQMQRLVMDEVSTIGEVFLKKNMREIDSPGEEIPLTYQLMPGDQLADDVALGSPLAEIPDEYKDATFINGIGYNDKGKKVGFVFYDDYYGRNFVFSYPFVNQSSRKFVPADEVHHVYNRKEVRYRRGWPLIGTGIVHAFLGKLLDEAQLSKQIVAASFAAFVHDSSAEISLDKKEEDGTEGNIDYNSTLQSGTIYELPTGKDVKFSDAPLSREYDAFDKAILRKIAGSVGVSYESLASNHSDANYSAARQSQLNSNRRLDRIREDIIIKQFIMSVIEDFKGYLNDLAIIPMKGLSYDIYRPGKIIIDPAKEVRPKVEEVRAGFRSWSEVIRERGMNPEVVADRIAKDKEMFDKLGLKLSIDNQSMEEEDENDPPQNSEGNEPR